MPRKAQHTRILSLPVPEPVCAGQLDSFSLEEHSRRTDLILDYHASLPGISMELIRRGGKIFERIHGVYQPRRLRFIAIQGLTLSGPYRNLAALAPDHPARTIVDVYAWRARQENIPFFLIFGRSKEDADLRFHARGVTREERTGAVVPFSLERDWSPAPPMPAGLVPCSKAVHQRFGGDPVDIFLDGKLHHLRLFVGGLEIQPPYHPQVNAVLNLGEEPSCWALGNKSAAGDRWVTMGEGSRGMSMEDITREAGWVIDRLHIGQRVLVHCSAGMNRSVTITCAVLILLEGLTAEAALARVRQYHPWARPDGHHWLALKWLSYKKI